VNQIVEVGVAYRVERARGFAWESFDNGLTITVA
jgi:hypothetical protein